MGAYDPSRRVSGVGNTPCSLMGIGEGPGENEHKQQKVFVGLTGEELTMYLGRARISRRFIYLTNVVKYWTGPGNPDPEPSDIERDREALMKEIRLCQPKVIAAIGRIALNFFLPDLTMEEAHGIPRRVSIRGYGEVILVPCIHPAAAFHQKGVAEAIYADFQVLGKVVRHEIEWDERADRFTNPTYVLAEGRMLFPDHQRDPVPASHDGEYRFLRQVQYSPPRPFKLEVGMPMGVDTEGSVEAPYCLTYSLAPGWGCMIKADDKKGIEDFNYFLAQYKPRIIFHFAQHDIPVLEAMGVVLPDELPDDTMILAYEAHEPQALKVLCRRHHGMVMEDYEDVTRIYDNRQARRFLLEAKVASLSLPKPEPVLEYKDGQPKIRRPVHIKNRIQTAIDSDKPRKAWFKIEPEIRAMLEMKMPAFSLKLVPFSKVLFYACRDADGTLRSYHTLAPWVNEDRHLAALYEMDRRLIPVTVQMEQTGMPINKERFRQISHDMDLGMAEIVKSLKKLNDGKYLNPNSPPQVRAFLFDKIGLKSKMLTKKTRQPSTNDKALEALKREHEGVGLITGYRGKSKIKSSFSEILPFVADDSDRIHASIKLTRTVTGRRAISEPPLQGIPVREEEGRRIRKAFEVPTPDLFLASGDLAQIEMRIMAHLSQDPKLIKLIRGGHDIHSITASQMFGVTVKEAKEADGGHKYRDPAKRTGFGIITGITGHGLFDQFEMNGIFGYSEEDCDRMIEDWFRIYPGVHGFIQGCREEGRRRGFVRTMWGRPRTLPGIWSNIRFIREDAERDTHSHKIQGSAADIIKRAEWRIWKALKRPEYRHARMLLTIHDEELLQGKSGGGREKALGEMLVACMVKDQELLKVPLEASYAYGRSWGDLK